MEFGIWKKIGKREPKEEIEIPYQESIKALGEKENIKFLEKLDEDTLKQTKIKEKLRKEKLRNQILLQKS